MYTNRWRKLSFALIQYNINNNPDIIYEYDYIYIDYMYAGIASKYSSINAGIMECLQECQNVVAVQ